MNAASNLFKRKIRRLASLLLVSGGMNVIAITLLIYMYVREMPPTPYCDLKPVGKEFQQTSLAEQRGNAEVLAQMQGLSFEQLISLLDNSQPGENGFLKRDLALATLVSFHYFDIQRAFDSKQTFQKRLFTLENRPTGEKKVLTLYSGLDDQQFKAISRFAGTERWPLTPQGLYLEMHRQLKEGNLDPTLAESFMLTPEFWTVQLLFMRAHPAFRKQELLEMLAEGNWDLLKSVVDQQRQSNDLSDARRQKILLDYMKAGSKTAGEMILQSDWEFATLKLDDAQVIALLQLLQRKSPTNEAYAKEMLLSPRSNGVWQQASLKLYEFAGEQIPEDWNYQTSLARFFPEKAKPAVIAETKPLPIVTKIKAPVAQAQAQAQPQAPAKKTTTRKTSSCRHYIVQEGDSLWKISRRFEVDMEVLKEYNRLQTSSIRPGTVLKIP